MTTTTKRRSSLDKFRSEQLWADHDGMGEGYLLVEEKLNWGGTRFFLFDPDLFVEQTVNAPSGYFNARPVGLHFTFDSDGRFDGASKLLVQRYNEHGLHSSDGIDGRPFYLDPRNTGRRGNPEFTSYKSAVETALKQSPRYQRNLRAEQEAREVRARAEREAAQAEARMVRKTPPVVEARRRLDSQIAQLQAETKSGLLSLSERFAELAEQADSEHGITRWVPHQGITDALQNIGKLNALLSMRHNIAGELFHPYLDPKV